MIRPRLHRGRKKEEEGSRTGRLGPRGKKKRKMGNLAAQINHFSAYKGEKKEKEKDQGRVVGLVFEGKEKEKIFDFS